MSPERSVTYVSGRSEVSYTFSLKKTDEGCAVWCPGLPGYCSQGATESDPMGNIREAIREYLAAARGLAGESGEHPDVAFGV